MTRTRQSGFSLLELLVAMTILAIIATLGFTQYRKHTAQASYLKAKDNLMVVGKGLDQYYLKHFRYPELGSFEALVEPNSPLVKEDLIPPNVPTKDPWGNPYEGSAKKNTYTLKCAGNPEAGEDYGPFTLEPGRLQDGGGTPAAAPGGPAK